MMRRELCLLSWAVRTPMLGVTVHAEHRCSIWNPLLGVFPLDFDHNALNYNF